MEIVLAAAIASGAALLGFILLKAGRGCSKRSKRRIRSEYETFLKEMESQRRKIAALVGSKPELKFSEAYRNLVRIWGVIEDMRTEIELYPSGDCLKHFREKFNFYRKLTEENLKKLAGGV